MFDNIGPILSSIKGQVLLVDMDGPLAHFHHGFVNAWCEEYPTLEPPIPLCRWRTMYATEVMGPARSDKVWKLIRKSGFFLDLEPNMPGLEALKEMLALGFEPFICTAPLSDCSHCASEKREWIVHHLGTEWEKRIIITHDKTIIRGLALIDDKPEISGVMDGTHGPQYPEWSQVVYDMPYNQNVTGHRIANDWSNWKTVVRNVIDDRNDYR